MFFAIGAGIRENVVSTKVRTLEDIAPTIGRLMGFSTAKSTGSVMSEILKLEVFRPGTDRALSGAD